MPGTPSIRLLSGVVARPGLSEVRFLAQAMLGLPTQAWSLGLEQGPDVSETGASEALAAALRAALADTDSRVAELHAAREYSAEDRYCVFLRARSRSVIAARADSVAPRFPEQLADAAEPATSPQAALQHCASCHVAGMAPAVPPVTAGRRRAHAAGCGLGTSAA